MDCVLLASGSKGNCIYIGNGTDAVVVDAGIGYLKRTLEAYQLPADTVRALCVTHEHADHVRSAKAFLKAAKVPAAASGGTLSAMQKAGLLSQASEKILMHDRVGVDFGTLTVTAFRTYHDAAEPTGFLIEDGESRIGVCLDTHTVSDTMLTALCSCDAVVLESNYSEEAMKTDRFPACRECRMCGVSCGGDCAVKRIYPRYLKDRIREDGHLSNEVSAKTLAVLKDHVGCVALAHLSENYNRPNLAREKAEDAAGESGCVIYVSDQLPEYREKRMVRFSV